MGPEHENQPQQPISATMPPSPLSPTPQTASVPTATPRRHKKLALTLLIAPTGLFILAIVCTIIASSLAAPQPQEGDLFGEPSPLKQVLTTLAFLSGAVAFLTWLPGIIIGIILLAKKK